MDAVTLFPYDESALKTLIYEVVRTALSNHEVNIQQPPEPPSDSEQRLYGDKAAAMFLGCTPLTIAKLRISGQIPFYRFGRKYYYKQSELDKALRHEARRFGELRGRRKDGK